jgi:hypothetical protein
MNKRDSLDDSYDGQPAEPYEIDIAKIISESNLDLPAKEI